jgi:hypothetical protein
VTRAVSRPSFAIVDQPTGGHDVHDIAGYLNFAVAWSFAHVALQPRLGILSEWRSRLGARDFSRFDVDAAGVIGFRGE